MVFHVHVFAWLACERLPNLFWELPDRERRGLEASGPFFEGDRFVVPPATREAMWGRSVRAWQALELALPEWGQPAPVRPARVFAGALHVLGEDGSRAHTEAAQVTHASARAEFNPRLDAYDVRLEGEATIPFLVDAAQAAEASTAPAAGPPEQGPVPAVGWRLQLYLQKGGSAPQSGAGGCDDSGRFFSDYRSLGGQGRNRIHGEIAVRLFPSYAVYVSLVRPDEGSYSAPVFFANGFGRKITGILTWTRSPLRLVTW
jgi:hypothetical protein